jgi:hypothetical protein
MKEKSNHHPDSEIAAPSVDVGVQETYDLAKELEQFHSTKAGVKDLLDLGITKNSRTPKCLSTQRKIFLSHQN